MDFGPATLERSYTLPATSTRLPNASTSSLPHHSNPHSQYSSGSHPSRSSDSTGETSTTTPFSQPSSYTVPPHANGHVSATDNVLNEKADKEHSLFQHCIALRNRLRGVETVDEYFEYVETEREEETTLDPVTLVWRFFRKGYPLLNMYNLLHPEDHIEVTNRVSKLKGEKVAVYKFVEACTHKLKIPLEQGFIVSDLYGEDTSGFVKAARLVNRVVDLMDEAELLPEPRPFDDSSGELSGTRKTNRQHSIHELVATERTYVRHMELLQGLQKHIQQSGLLQGDAIHDIFLNLSALLDFQRRFLIRVEQMNSEPEDKQDWGELFNTFGAAFRVYEPYISNQQRSARVSLREHPKLQDAPGPPEVMKIVADYTTFCSFLMKPMQRMTKYPIILENLLKGGDYDEPRVENLQEAVSTIKSVLTATNESVARDDLSDMLDKLHGGVDDWKGHDPNLFGELYLCEKLKVVKSDTDKPKKGNKDEKEYFVYLFDKIIICCKDDNAKAKAKEAKAKDARAKDAKAKGISAIEKDDQRPSKYSLKGRIFFQNVTDCVWSQKTGLYQSQIFWRGDYDIRSFIIRFPTEEIFVQWKTRIYKQLMRHGGKKWVARLQNHHRNATESSISEASIAGANGDYYMLDQMRSRGQLENPYGADDEYDDGYDDDESVISGQNRNASNPNLRSRSTTGESFAVQSNVLPHRGPPMRNLASQGPSLSVRTQQLPPPPSSTPSERVGQSYFSPVESPISTRTSSSSGMMPFPRQSTPLNGWHNEDPNRFTAPPGTRAYVKESIAQQIDGRSTKPTGGPAARPTHDAMLSQTRIRSASSPNVNTGNPSIDSIAAQAPPMPNSHEYGDMNRSQSNSPVYGNGGPSRAAAASPLKYSETIHPDANGYFHHGDSSPQDQPNPSQLKVRIQIPSEECSLALVCAFNISYESLRSRVEAKLARLKGSSIGKFSLKYMYDDELVSIQTDEDVESAFETWKDRPRDSGMGGNVGGSMGEIELYCFK